MRKIWKDENFDRLLFSVEKKAWYSFKEEMKFFLDNHKTNDHEENIFQFF